MENRMGRALRRGVALGLALAAAWGVSLTADVGSVRRSLSALGERPALTVSLLAAQMGELPGGDRKLTGWGRLLLKGSPLLAAGEEAVTERLSAGGQPDSDEPDGAGPVGDHQFTDFPPVIVGDVCNGESGV